jgi:hypothetical protein
MGEVIETQLGKLVRLGLVEFDGKGRWWPTPRGEAVLLHIGKQDDEEGESARRAFVLYEARKAAAGRA